jgi:ribonucleoside-diphosphate reductase alpha chain
MTGSAALTDEPALTENGRKVLEARYLKKNEMGMCVERPAHLFRRVARTIADVEKLYGADNDERQRWEDRFYNLMTSGRFMPNSPTLMNAGREMGMLSACFVLPVRDSIVDIFNSIKHTALIQKAGGGTGFAFDELRPTGDFIKSSGGTTSGPITFWRAFSEATNAIQQGAFRRGANMGMMYVHHPDILKFLHAKQDLNQFNNYNISVKMTDAWMEEFRAAPDSPHVVRNPRTGKSYVIPRDVKIWEYDIRNLIEIECVEPVSARGQARYYTSPRLLSPQSKELPQDVYTKREIWEIIVRNAWQTGEPGVVFMDRINENNPTPQVGRIEATNPCGEQPLLPYEACNLGSVNLGMFVREACTPQAEVDWEALRETIHLATRFLDDVIDANQYPLPEIDAICKANRKIGLGIMGFADALYRLNVPYNSEDGIAWGERFMRFINDEGHECSSELAAARGSFPNWKGSIWQTKYDRPMRNAAVTTVAPTGTISMIANCSGGIEPMFSLAFYRYVLKGQRHGDKPLVEVNDTFRTVAEQRGFLRDGLFDELAASGSLAHVEDVPEDVKRIFVCAHDISPEWHARMQAAFQRHCDSSISKTINFPNDAPLEHVEKIYQLSYELGCKGVTVYRDGCRDTQPMVLKANDEKKQAATAQIDESKEEATPVANTQRKPIEPADLPAIVSGFRIRQLTPFGNMHVKITVDPRTERELEVFAQLGKGGDVANGDLEAICRTGSLYLRVGGSLKHLIKQWEGIGTSHQVPTRAGRIMSLPDGLACALKKYLRAKERFGLRALLLGEIEPADIENPPPTPHDRLATPLDQTPSASRETPRSGNGGSPPPARRTLTASADDDVIERRATTHTSRLTDELRPEARATASSLEARGTNGKGKRHAYAEAEADADALYYSDMATATALAEPEEAEAEAEGVLQVATLDIDVPDTECEQMTVADETTPVVVLSDDLVSVRNQHDAASGYILRCPQCGGVVARQEGCLKCASHCGWAAC